MKSSEPPHMEIVKARIRIAHGSLRQFEIDKGLLQGSVRDSLRGKGTRNASAIAIADFVGIPVEKLFPSVIIGQQHNSPNREYHRLNSAAR